MCDCYHRCCSLFGAEADCKLLNPCRRRRRRRRRRFVHVVSNVIVVVVCVVCDHAANLWDLRQNWPHMHTLLGSWDAAPSDCCCCCRCFVHVLKYCCCLCGQCCPTNEAYAKNGHTGGPTGKAYAQCEVGRRWSTIAPNACSRRSK